ncbi:MAG: AsmA-like C-terminal region-containing protein [Alphaproteobacteria bacterium]
MTDLESQPLREVAAAVPWPIRGLWFLIKFFLWAAAIVWLLMTLGLNYAAKGKLEETMTRSFDTKSTVSAMHMGWNFIRPTVAAMGITVGADEKEPVARVGNFEVGMYLVDPAPGPEGTQPMYYVALDRLNIHGRDYGSYEAKIREPKKRHTFIQELKGQMGKATLSGTAYDDNKCNWKADLTAEKVDYSLFAKGVKGGEARVTLKMEGNHQGRDNLTRTLNGRITLIGGAGELEGNTLNVWAGNLLTSFLPGQSKDTHLNCAVADFDVKDGVAEARTVIIDTDKATITGKGTVDLVKGRVDMRFEPRTKGLASISLATPMVVSGPFDQVTTHPDAEGVATKFGGLVLSAIAPPAALIPLLTGKSTGNACADYLGKKDPP